MEWVLRFVMAPTLLIIHRNFVKKHGNEAWNARRAKQEAAAREAQEEEDMQRYRREGAAAMAAFEANRAARSNAP